MFLQLLLTSCIVQYWVCTSTHDPLIYRSFSLRNLHGIVYWISENVIIIIRLKILYELDRVICAVSDGSVRGIGIQPTGLGGSIVVGVLSKVCNPQAVSAGWCHYIRFIVMYSFKEAINQQWHSDHSKPVMRHNIRYAFCTWKELVPELILTWVHRDHLGLQKLLPTAKMNSVGQRWGINCGQNDLWNIFD